MKIINYNEYAEKENKFFKKHPVEKVFENGNWKERSKHYICEDGAELWEDIAVKEFKEKKTVLVEAYGIEFEQEIEVSIKLLVTEIWNTDDSGSCFYIERF